MADHTTWFISDLHLDESRPHTVRAFEHFLLRLDESCTLYILGDLFEFWIGDDDDAPLAARAADALSALTARGTSLFFMPGNRDFLLGTQYCARVGATLLEEPTLIDLYGSPTLLLHGDTLCADDAAYQQLRATVRSPQWRRETLALSLAQRRSLAREMREQSSASKAQKTEQIMDVNASEVDRVLNAFGVQTLIHGHTHRPGKSQHGRRTRWVLGEWLESAWVLRADASGLELQELPLTAD